MRMGQLVTECQRIGGRGAAALEPEDMCFAHVLYRQLSSRYP